MANVLDALRANPSAPSAPTETVVQTAPRSTNVLDALRGGGGAPRARQQNAAVGVGRKVVNAAMGPLGAIDAVLGAPERTVEGTIGAKGGNAVQRLGHGVYEAFHPNDLPTRQANLERAEGNIGMGASDTGTGFGSKAHNFVRDTAAQTIMDPLTYLPFIGEGRMVERGVVGGARALHAALPPETRGVLQKTADFFKANPEMDAALGKQGAPIYHGIYRSERGKLGAQATRDANLLQRNRKAIETGNVPTDVKSRLLQEPYDNGTADMRAEAVRIAHEQGIPLNEHTRPPTNMLAYPVRGDYEELLKHTNPTNRSEATTRATPFSRVEYRPANAGFEEKRQSLGQEDVEGLYDRIDRRLAMGRNVVFERNVDDRILAELIKRNAAGPDTGKLLADPDLFNKLRAKGVTQGVKIAGIPALQRLSDAYRTALFVNPLPHMFNIARLTYLAGGARAVARGMSHFFKGGPKGELRERIEEHTGIPEYLSGQAPQFADKIPGVRAMRTFGQGKLGQFDVSMRGGYLEELDRTLGKGAMHSPEEYAKGSEVSHGIGGYDETSPVVEAIRAAGGPFAQWRLGVVPRAVGQATLRHPERVERYARTMDNLKQQTGIEFGGPEEDLGRIIQSPQSAARYLTSPSTVGPIPAAIVGMAGSNRKADLLKSGEEMVRQYVPGAGPAEEAAHLSPYSEGPNTAENTALGLLSGYTSSNLSSGQKRRQTQINKSYDAAIRANMARGDYRRAFDLYMARQKVLRQLQAGP